MQVWIVQHAEKVAAPGDPGLTAAGHAQAARLARHLLDCGVSTIWSSPLRRARETAAHIEEALGMRADVEAGLRERMNWDGAQSIESFTRDWAHATQDRTFLPPTGDSSEQAGQRFIDAIEEVRRRSSEDAIAAVVSHGGVTVDALRTLFGDGTVQGHSPGVERDGIANCAITRLRSDGAGWTLERLGDTSHLIPSGSGR